MKIDVQLEDDKARDALAASAELRRRLLPHLATALGVGAEEILGKARRERFSGEGPFPPSQKRLGRRSGRLFQSLRYTGPFLDQATGRVAVFLGSEMPYFPIHEFGGRTKPHTIRPRNGKALRFLSGGNVVFAKSVNHPGSVMPRRAPLTTAILEHGPAILTRLIRRAYHRTLQEGGLR